MSNVVDGAICSHMVADLTGERETIERYYTFEDTAVAFCQEIGSLSCAVV